MLLTKHVDANATLVSLIKPLAIRPGFIPTLLPEVQVVMARSYVASSPDLRAQLHGRRPGKQSGVPGAAHVRVRCRALSDSGAVGAFSLRDFCHPGRALAGGVHRH